MNNVMKRANAAQPATFGSVVDQIFQNNLTRFFDDDFQRLGETNGLTMVPVNIRETDKSYEVELVVPGLKKEDIQINFAKDILTVSHENKEENNQGDWLRQEYKKPTFNRSFYLDDTVDANNITARYEDGILFLSLPKKENVQKISRKIEIE